MQEFRIRFSQAWDKGMKIKLSEAYFKMHFPGDGLEKKRDCLKGYFGMNIG